ncbi:MAG: response regulator [Wolinella sp.]
MIIRALVADDSPIMRKIVRTNLEKINVKLIKEAKDGEETLAALKPNDVNLLFLDLNMPEPNGWDILDRLYKTGKTDEISVIIISNEMGEEARNSLQRLGVSGFIPKPFNIHVFQDVVTPIVSMIQNEEKREKFFNAQREEELMALFGESTPNLSISEGYLCFEFSDSIVRIDKKDLVKIAILERKVEQV